MRYVVDARVGEVAVRDTLHPQYRVDGCLSGDPATVKKWPGRKYKNPRPPFYAVWYVPAASMRAAERLCQLLNAVVK